MGWKEGQMDKQHDKDARIIHFWLYMAQHIWKEMNNIYLVSDFCDE